MSTYPPDGAVQAALEAVGAVQPAEWAPIIGRACRAHEINSPLRVAHFIANACHETGKLKRLVESFDYTPARLKALFAPRRITMAQADALGRKPSERVVPLERQQRIANIIYGGEWGRRNLGNTQPNDGWYFRGKGLIQLTGRANHTRFAKAIETDVVRLQEMLETREGAAMSAASFWLKTGCNVPADAGACGVVRKLVNGGTLGLAEVLAYANTALSALTKHGEIETA